MAILNTNDIRDPAIRDAALRFERQTGAALSELCWLNDEQLIERWLNAMGYPTLRAGTPPTPGSKSLTSNS
jgi:hypothetical protein